MNKLGFTEKEVGHMTYTKWHKLYKAYQRDFDLELTMKVNQKRYRDFEDVEVKKEHIISF